MRLLLELARGERRRLATAVLAGATWMAARVAVPKLSQHAIDHGLARRDLRASLLWAAAILAAGLTAAAFTATRHYFANMWTRRAERRLRRRLFAHFQRLHIGFHDRASVGDLMGRANSDLQEFERLFNLVPSTIAAGGSFAAAIAILFATDARLAALSLSTVVVLTGATVRFARLLQPASAGVQRDLAALTEVVEDTVAGMRVVKGLGAEEAQAAKLRGAVDSIYEHSLELARIRATYLPTFELLPLAGIAIVLFVGGRDVLAGRLTVGELVAFNAYLLMLVYPLQRAGAIVPQVQRTLAAARRIWAVLSVDPAIRERRSPLRLPADGRGEVRFEGVRFGYAQPPADDRPAIVDLDLVVPAGTSVALVGAAGCGKSTLARLLLRFYDVEAGRILLDGVDVRELALADLRRAVGVVFEDTFLFEDTVAANIALAEPSAARERIERAARLAGAHDFVTALPDGYDTVLGERGYSLSGGQRQRIAIARVLLADPRVLILDDATSAVDPAKEREIREALVEVMRGRTTIVIAHRPATIALADRVVMLDHGRVVAEGPHRDLLVRHDAYARFLTGESALSA